MYLPCVFEHTRGIKSSCYISVCEEKQKYQVTNVDAKSGNQNATGSEIQELSVEL